MYRHKKVIVFGYNELWKQNVNMGKNNNRKFCLIPYFKLLQKIRNKFSNTRTKIIETAEYYTSKCDSLSLEAIENHNANGYLGKRIKRGLFSSATNKLINADLNGAINIMRRYCKINNIKYDEVIGQSIFNPSRIKYKW